MTNRLKQLNSHFGPQATRGAREPTLNIWESMGLDKLMSASAVEKRKATAVFMDEIYDDLKPYYVMKEFPFFVIPKL